MKEVFSVYDLKDFSQYDSDVFIGAFPDKQSAEAFINKSQYNRDNYYWTKETLFSSKDLLSFIKNNKDKEF